MKNTLKRLWKIIKENPLTTVLIVIAAIAHLVIILPSGSHYCFNGFCGDYFWGVHEHDGIWHIAVAESAFKVFPPRNPIFSGLQLSGYNSILDFILFLFGLLGISPLIMYFKVLPVIWFVGFTYISIKLAKSWTKNPFFLFLLLFLNYFGASFSFVIPLVRERLITGSSSLLSMQAILTLTNVQLAFSYIFLMWTVFLLSEKRGTRRQIITLSILLFFQWGLKFYTGVVASLIVAVFFLLNIITSRKKKDGIALILCIFFSCISVILNYNPFGGVGGSILLFKPLALIWPLIEDPGLFYSEYWAQAKYIFLSSSRISPRFLIFSFLLTMVFLILNFGGRILGFISLVKHQFSKEKAILHHSLGTAIFISILIPIFFIQRGMWWNTIQFLFPVYILLNIYTADFISVVKNRLVQVVLVGILILVSLPYATDALRGYFVYPGEINISNSELAALSFLKRLPDGVVYTPMYSSKLHVNNQNSKPLFAHVDSAYVAAYTGKQSLYTNFVQLILLNVDHEKRRDQIAKGDCSLVSEVQYAYIPISQTKDIFFKKCILNSAQFKKVYRNSASIIYEKQN